MTAVDASVLIALLDERDRHHTRAVAVLDRSTSDLVLSAVTRAEVLVGPARTGRAAEAEAALADLGVRTVDVAEPDAVALAELRASTGLKLPDCCVLLVAAGSGSIVTFDDRLASAARARAITVLD